VTTTIEWTDATWNPIVGCSRVSKGCEHCYAERVAHRGMSAQHRGLTVMGKHGPRWNGTVRFVAEKLSEPLGWRKPRRVFVNSMSDLFHEGVTDEQIAAVFGAMAACPQHTFQVLTKRPERAKAWFQWVSAFRSIQPRWPLPNVWLGVSVEDQATADDRIPLMLETPAAVRWVSYEPALGPVDFGRWLCRHTEVGPAGVCVKCKAIERDEGSPYLPPRLDWIVIGGESGPGARPFDLAWARSTVEACRAAGVPCFVKQLGARPMLSAAAPCVEQSAESIARHGEYDPDPIEYDLRDRKGKDPSEWPEDLRVREWPPGVEPLVEAANRAAEERAAAERRARDARVEAANAIVREMPEAAS
jgi:protein gp37